MSGSMQLIPISMTSSENEIQENYSMWVTADDEIYSPNSNIKVMGVLPSGFYKFVFNQSSGKYDSLTLKTNYDELIELPNNTKNEIINDIIHFWDSEKKYREYNYVYKRGILLYGESGSGKTSVCVQLSKTIVSEYGGLVFKIETSDDLYSFIYGVDGLRKIEPNRKILCIIEDIDDLVMDDEITVLNLLDGINQIDNVVYVATTNQPENLKERILNRPSRFDRRYYIGMPDAESRRHFLMTKLHDDDRNKINIDNIIKKTEGMSMAHLSELVKSIIIFNKNEDDVIKTLSSMSDYISSTKFNKKGKAIGF